MKDFFAQRYEMTIVLEASPHLSFCSLPVPNGTFGRGIFLYSLWCYYLSDFPTPVFLTF